MDPEELKRLEQESQKPYQCPISDCPDYMIHPICHNHAHVKCEQYDHNRAVDDFLKRRYEFDDTGMYRGRADEV